MKSIQQGDQIVIKFKQDNLVEVFESSDFELESPVEEKFAAGELADVTVFGIDDIKVDVQFGDGSIAFIRLKDIDIIKIN